MKRNFNTGFLSMGTFNQEGRHLALNREVYGLSCIKVEMTDLYRQKGQAAVGSRGSSLDRRIAVGLVW
jgi:hypothetical protein